MAYEVDIQIDQGTTFTQNFVVYTDPAASVLADVSGFTGLMEVRYNYDSPVVLFTANTGNNMVINVATSTVTVNVGNTDFNGVVFVPNQDESSIDLVYDLFLTNASLQSYRIAQGTLTINRAVTHS
jgi:hypothetical protein